MKAKKAYPEQTCPQCDKVFKPTRDWQRFCSTLCSGRHHNDQRANKQAALKQELEELRAKVKQ